MMSAPTAKLWVGIGLQLHEWTSYPALRCNNMKSIRFPGMRSREEEIEGCEKSLPFKLRIAYIASVGVMAPVWMAAECGAFKADAFEVKVIYIQAIDEVTH